MRSRIACSGAIFSAFLALSAVGCGSLDGHTGTPSTLATVHGGLTKSSDVQLGGAARVAVVWLNTGGKYSVADDLPVQPMFPSSFTIQFQNPPPQAAMFDGGQGV